MIIDAFLKCTCGDGADEKRARVLEGALGVFLAYGFNRTTMHDIARASDLSRPALYLLFRNKADIYRGLAAGVLAEISDRVDKTLAGDGALVDRLDEMVAHAFSDLLKDIEESPHGPELFDMKNSLAGDLFAQWRDGMAAKLVAVISADVEANGVDLVARGLSPLTLAHVFLDTLEGMKARLSDPQCHLEAAQGGVRVLVAALRP